MSRKLDVKDLLEFMETGEQDEKLFWLMIPKTASTLTLNSQCILTDSEELQNNNQLYSDYECSINIDDLEDILDNLCQQVENPTTEQKLEALNYYIANDAFAKFVNNNL